ncbi:MAG: hypothetical protein H3C43_03430, partial [Leptonema sp. (in: Bacteria)]|nr:hypothetical protein [Leptonema sp. (in: bacteria)]
LTAGLLVGAAALRYYPKISSIGSTLWFSNDIETISLEAGKAGSVELRLTAKAKAIYLIVADRRMNRQWNNTHLETRVGLKLGQILNQQSIGTAVFDRADSNLAPDSYLPTSSIAGQVRDAFIAVKAYTEARSQLPIIIFAHGDGCISSLLAIEEFSIEPEQLLLFGCAYDHSLLETYGDMIFNTMRLSSVDDEQMNQARTEWNEWLSKPKYEEITEDDWLIKQKEMLKQQVHPDLVAFRKTISVFQRPNNINFLIESKRLLFPNLVESALKKSRVLIEQYPSEFDEEISAELIKRNQIQSEAFGPRYRFKILFHTDHYLFEKDSPPASPIENMMSRSNPFKSLSPALLHLIEEKSNQ